MTEYTKLKPEVLTLWTDALESGEYAQTKGWLHLMEDGSDRPGGWCCLGVLCDVASKAGVDMNRQLEVGGKVESFDDHRGGLPPSVRKWAFGVETTFDGADGAESWAAEDYLVSMNDGMGQDFRAISRWVKENLSPEEES
jgi:hypothetical protein